jgi:hypothetical protein
MRFLLFLLLALTAVNGQTRPPKPSKQPPTTRQAPEPAASPQTARGKSFVQDVVRMAVALPQGDQQDRLRVLNSAISVLTTSDKKAVAPLAREAVRIESELIAVGQEPVVSVLANGYSDCKSAAEFVQGIYPQNLAAAEQSVIGALTHCPKETLPLVQSRIDTALEQRMAPPRLLMATVDIVGTATPWAQDKIAKLFDSLPTDAERSASEAPNYAAMYEQSAPKVDKNVARESGVKLLEWLGKLEPSAERYLATTVTADAMKQTLGEQAYNEALERNVMARQAADNPGQPGEISHEEEESSSAEEASKALGSDQSAALSKMPPSMRARQAAANGFSAGTSGDKDAASRYFDMAFSAADENWAQRKDSNSGKRAAEVLEEVAEAAAHVDAIAALKRAQGLGDSTAQAISMIAVARVVANTPASVPDEASSRPR